MYHGNAEGQNCGRRVVNIGFSTSRDPQEQIFDHPTRQGPGDQYAVGEIDEDSTRRLLGVPARGKNQCWPPSSHNSGLPHYCDT